MATSLILNFLFLVILSSCNAYVPLNPRIVGGTEAADKVAPYIVSIQYNGVHDCGGSILNQHWVLTAGHCVLARRITNQWTLVAGTNDVKTTSVAMQRRKISNYKVHPKYVGGPTPYDIALIYTAQPFYWSTSVRPIKLPKQGYKASGFATLYGWGSISKSSYPVYPKNLRQATHLPILTYDQCKRALTAIWAGATTALDKTNICTGPLNHGIQACSADSGGPLVQTNDKEHLLIGVVSWGPTPCGRAPSVFVQVADFVDWIKEQQK